MEISLIKFYNNPYIKNEIVRLSEDKESVGSYNNKGFAKRPNTIQYPQDVVELVKKGITSFHISEETWDDPLLLRTGMRKKEQDELRKGWDLILDIDCPEFEYSKIAAKLIMEYLNYLEIEDVSCKFSGNHGFHIAIPYEAFPEKINEIPIKNLFPEAPRKIAEYLTKKIEPFIKEEFEFLLGTNFLDIISEKINKPKEKFHNINNDLIVNEILEIDTILISSRHLFRCVYSLNEKSGLISVPLNKKDIVNFKKDWATKEYVLDHLDYYKKNIFLDRNVTKESAKKLFIEAYDFTAVHETYQKDIEQKKEELNKKNQEYFESEELRYPVESFPPCIKDYGLKGLKDGKKRFAFILRNFLTSCNWEKAQIRDLFNAWNENNEESLKQTQIETQLRYLKRVLPPNCDKKEYYVDLGICHPDNLCKRIKNPVSYATRKAQILAKQDEIEAKKIKKEQVKAKKTKKNQETNEKKVSK